MEIASLAAGDVIELLGVRVRVLATADDTGGAYTLLDYQAPPDLPGPLPHWHQRYTEAFYVLEGRLTLHVDGEERTLGPGELATVRPGQVHQFRNGSDAPTRFLIHFTPGGFEGYFIELAEFVRREGTWPPRDPSGVLAIAARYDTFSPAVGQANLPAAGSTTG